jgi:glycosyltransferase involved in cell wall biosynthesis
VESPTSILTVNRVAHFGGVERIIVTAAEAAHEHGLRPVLACPTPGRLAEEMQARELPVRWAWIDRGRATVSPWGVARTLNGFRLGAKDILTLAQIEEAAILHVHHPVAALQALLASRRLGLPLLMHVHETLPMPPQYSLLARLVRGYCAHWLCVSDASRRMVRALGVPEHRIELLYNAVSPPFLQTPAPAPELGRPGPHLGLFGVLEPRKGHAIFLQAIASLHQYPKAQVWIVGTCSFAEYRVYVDTLRTLATELGLCDRVHFLGYRADVPALMAGMDVVVLPSTGFESLPTVLIEACMLGRPVVASDVGGVTEIVTHNQTGLVVCPGDVAALSSALAYILSGAGPRLGAQARLEAHKRFTPELFGKGLVSCYQNLIGTADQDATSEHSSAVLQ